MKTTVQKMKNILLTLEKAQQYYSVLSVLNSLKLSKKQIEVLAFTAIRGNISSGGSKELFISEFGSTKASLGNIIHKLTKKKLLVKKDGKLVVNPKISLDFNNTIILQICLETK